MVDPAVAARRLVSAVQELSLARDLAGVMAVVRAAARQLSGADGATFVLRDENRCYYADEDAIAPLWKGQRFPMEACVSGWAMLHREAVAIPDIYRDPRVPADAYRPTFVKSLVMVPIRTAAPVGAIGVYWAEPHRASESELELLGSLANSTSIAMENVQLYQELEQRVQRRTAELVRVQREKEELSAMIVHDLRSPANGIMLASRARMRHAETADGDKRRWSNVYASAEAIHRMAMNLLDVMRSEAGTFQPRLAPCAPAGLIATMLEQVTPIASAQGVTLAARVEPDLPDVPCDAELIARVLQNLADNAIRYSPDGGTVTLAARVDGDALELRVVDDGPGIPADKREAVFEKWTRLDEGGGGRGLGLAFCKLAVASHGGAITIEPRAPHGTEFVVRLPRG